jgi:hypothetical protein
VVADAPPVIVLVADKTCFKSIVVMLFAATETPDAIDTPSKARVNVPEDPAVLATTMFVTTAVVADGTVYKVVAVLVDAAVLASTLLVVAISYYLLVTLYTIFKD